MTDPKVVPLRRKRPGPITAGELIAQLAADPDYQQRKAIDEARRLARSRVLRASEQPIVAELRKAGFDVDSVWDLVNTSDPYFAALPILLRHLEKGGYPEPVMHSLARALSVRPMAFAWFRLRELYLKADEREQEGALAGALAAAATEDHYEDLLALLDERSRGDSRIHFLCAITRVGRARGWDVVESLKDDPLFGREATAMLKRRRRPAKVGAT